jgi:hypothetical protein
VIIIIILTTSVVTDAAGDVRTADLDPARARIVELLKRLREGVLAERSALGGMVPKKIEVMIFLLREIRDFLKYQRSGS